MKLNIYDKKQVVKTYEADTYDLMFGTVEDVANAIDLDKLNTGSDAEIIKLIGGLVITSMPTITDLLKDIFDGITDDEIKHTKVKEIAAVFLDVVKYTLAELGKGSGKN